VIQFRTGVRRPVPTIPKRVGGSVVRELRFVFRPPPLETRTIDGTGNNPENAEWGSTGSELLRIASTEYADDVSEPTGDDRLNAREISNLVSQQTEQEPNDRNLSALVWQWGQFVDHGIVLTRQACPGEAFSIDVPIGDASFDPDGTGDQVIPFDRSEYDPASGDASEKFFDELGGSVG